jgi:hypothetical protein
MKLLPILAGFTLAGIFYADSAAPPVPEKLKSDFFQAQANMIAANVAARDAREERLGLCGCTEGRAQYRDEAAGDPGATQEALVKRRAAEGCPRIS